MEKKLSYLVFGTVTVLTAWTMLLAFLIFPLALSPNPAIPDNQEQMAELLRDTLAKMRSFYILAVAGWIATLAGGYAIGAYAEKSVKEKQKDSS